ncbi:Thrombospondin type-1 domain-containing protein 7A [Takifugu flavidus]|uniref:Thrombospondin type-1 domain-containing protein 7A n=1 Tax=Takifugu flavidus TaxID=433684 RepID=A0A5C6PJK4_9TELE|nr:Thrombospondin type-1 domain-containing protein 7A [Takifugu flavidus]
MSPPVDGGSCVPPCLTPKSFCGEDGICTCGPGFTEVFLHTGQLNQCAPIPILEIPTWEDKKGDVKTIRAIDTPSPTPALPGLPGRTWYLQPYGPDGKLKIWVYGVAIGAFVLFIFIVSMIYLACSYCATVHQTFRAQEASSSNGAVVWADQSAPEVTYTCPDCQELAQTSGSG